MTTLPASQGRYLSSEEIKARADPINRETEDLASSVMDDLTDEQAGFSVQGDNRWKDI